MTPKPRPSWTIPITGDHGFEVEVDDAANVVVRRPVIVRGRRAAIINVGTFSAVETCQLGMALQDASRIAAETRAKLEGRSKRSAPSGVSANPCTACGQRHRLGEFSPGTFAYTKVADRERSIPIGARVLVREWSQYGGNLYYRVHRDGEPDVRANYAPCELEK